MKPFGCAINASVTIMVVWAPSIEKRLHAKNASERFFFSFINPTKYMYIKNLLF